MACVLCQDSRPRRVCPAAGGDICAVCCGNEREVSLACPLDCEYLRQARVRDQQRRTPPKPEEYPNPDIRIGESVIRDNAPLIGFVAHAIASTALSIPGATDSDTREALRCLVKTCRTLQSGVYYESVPSNTMAAAIYAAAQRAVSEFQSLERQELGFERTRPASVLAVFAFFERLGFEADNGRLRGRAFLDMLRGFAAPPDQAAAEPAAGSSTLILP